MMKSIISMLFFGIFTQQTLSSPGSWNYDHMEWEDNYEMCGASDESPINIQSTLATVDDTYCSANFDWEIDYSKKTWKIKNNGHSIVLNPIEEVSELGDDLGTTYIDLVLNENTIAKFPNYFALTDDHKEYCFAGLHFHWGNTEKTGSEHLLNGKQFPLEAHFVHYSCDHASVGTTLEQFETAYDVTTAKENGEDVHQLGVVGIFFDIVEDRINPAFEQILNNLTLNKIMYNSNSTFINDFDVSQMIPDHINTEGYYAYKGSLTTPPCTNIVNWHVMNAHGYIGKEQMERFRKLMNTNDYAIAPNYREIQENINTVYSCIDVNTVTTVKYIENKMESDYIIIAAVVAFVVAVIIVGIVAFVIYQKQKQALFSEINSISYRLRSMSSGSQNGNQNGNQYGDTNV